ncbi:hypothetical protein DNTS_029701 [Danionella cerebrum]|uniref:Uncharacterized protein n=1 Tax=Danionella cerebrum TaxID=2873325 RepID=A0A553QUI7_9TELE|nr:hypothetical protein DNTS_029701 [Danionella translucida]
MEGSVLRLHGALFAGGLCAQPIIVNFHEVLQSKDDSTILQTIKNEDVLRAVVALFDTSLPDVGPKDIHSTVHYPGVHTVIVTRDHADVLEEYSRPLRKHGGTLTPSKTPTSLDPAHTMLKELYSDSEDNSEEESSSEDASTDSHSDRWSWEQFREGLQELVSGAKERKERRRVRGEDGKIPPSAVGVESLIVAAACYELKTLTSGNKVLQLSLLAVRKHYRHRGIGRYILELLKAQSIVGQYETLIAHADSDSIDFFKMHDFTEDLMFNDKFRELKDEWMNSILMSYLPPFTTDLELRNPNFSLGLQEVEMDLEMARLQALSSYQHQVMCVSRLLKEVKILRTQLDAQREELEVLNHRLEQEKQKRHDVDDQGHFKPESEDQEMPQPEQPFIQTPEGAGGC